MKRSFSNYFILIPLLAATSLFGEVSLQQIHATVDDELYALAEQQIWTALSTGQPLETESELTILLARALAGQGQITNAMILIDESQNLPRQEAFAYWRARLLFDANDLPGVFLTLDLRKQQLEDSPFEADALRLKGMAARSANDLKTAQHSFETFRKKFPTHPDAAQNLLDLARVSREREKKGAVTQAFHRLIETYPENPLSHTARLELARYLVADGGKREREEAASVLADLGNEETAASRLRVAAWIDLATLYQRAGDSAGAADALLQAETLTSEAELIVRQKTARANLLIEQGQTNAPLALFDEAIAEVSDSKLAADILIQKADALLQFNRFTAAERAFQSYLDITTDPTAQVRAFLGKGWSLWEQARYEESATAFENAAAGCAQPTECVTARMKAGDARFAAKQFDKAEENYSRVCEYTKDPNLCAQASFQRGLALLNNGQTEAARSRFLETEKTFPSSEFAPKAALQLAILLKKENNWPAALDAYRQIAATYTNATMQATALHQQGLILYRQRETEGAQKLFETVIQNFSDSQEAPQAFYMDGFCRYLQGDIEDALQTCQTFVEKYPESVWTPDVLFWLSEHYYNHGNYAEAEKKFLEIVELFPANKLADEALFWAGNAQLKQNRYMEAFSTCTRLAKEYPLSSLLLQIRFAQGQALTGLEEFSRAILAFEEVIKTAPDDLLAARARGRIGDCLFTLGSSDPARYQEALDAYKALYNRPLIPLDTKLQALYKIARTEEKLGLSDKAFAHYMETVYLGAEQNQAIPPESALWFTRAAFAAGAGQERQQKWKEAVNIYERILLVESPATAEALTRIEKIKKEHPELFKTK